MKFAKELEQDLVPEWRAKYLDYKEGKKKVKEIARALRHVHSTPKTPGRRRPANLFSSASYQLPIQNRSPFEEALADTLWESRASDQNSLRVPKRPSDHGKAHSAPSNPGSASAGKAVGSALSYFDGTPQEIDFGQSGRREHEDESRSLWDSGAMTNYGSIIASPPSRPTRLGPPALELPDPALSPSIDSFPRHNRAWRNSKMARNVPNVTPPIGRAASTAGDAYAVGRTHTPPKLSTTLLSKHRNLFKPRRTISTPEGGSVPHRSPFLTRMFSHSGDGSPKSPDVHLEAYKEFDVRQAQFFNFLDSELNKIESFYKMKEVEATERLKLLREQLHEMRDRRLEEVLAAQNVKELARQEQQRLAAAGLPNGSIGDEAANGKLNPLAQKWIKPLEHALSAGKSRFGKNTMALEQTASLPSASPRHMAGHHHTDSWRDFTRRRPHHEDEVPYRVAKKKLKLALQEFYRGLELLKSYALLNRTAFRKINKKYDKAVKARPTGRYMSEKVNKAWFVQSEVLDGHIVAVEDLYARYFERGNHKVAVGKLRSRSRREEHYNGTVFRNGILLAAGAVFGIQGCVYGAQHLRDPDPVVRVNTSYLLQIYGGYFLSLFLFLLFCLDCRTWARAKINYVFIFEFDTRHSLDWRQLSELPCLFLFLEGFAIWLNFRRSGADAMFLYWPVVLVGVSIIILFFPGPILYHRSREWWAYSNFRLLLAGLYPVEFRDFFLGDMYCSLTYAMGNLSLFFCLYAQGWNDPSQCNSTHSRLLGFFSALPGVWRALQCLRRYYDTRNAFPHLVNCGKYFATILYYMSLSLYRIDQIGQLKAMFIFFATINSVYTSVWDIAMDWSLCNPYAKNPFLRDVLGYKRPWVYYLAMIVDPILRFNWIFYAIFAEELQHSALLSFLVGFTEICRRGIWTLFRVENEHCTNVGRFRASRDVPLPYDIRSPIRASAEEISDAQDQLPSPGLPRHSNTWGAETFQSTSGAYLESVPPIEAGPGPATGTLRRRRTLADRPPTPVQSSIARVGTLMSQAHAEDFERKRRPGTFAKEDDVSAIRESPGSSDEDEDEGVDVENEQDVLDAAAILDRHRGHVENV